MTRITYLYVLALGAFIIAGAHYARNGADGWYVGWVLIAVVLTSIGRFHDNPSKST